MRLIVRFIILLAAIVFLLRETAFAGDIGDPAKILAVAEKTVRYTNAHGRLSMNIVTSQWERNLKLEFWYMGVVKAKVLILEPSKERGTISLRNDGQMWNYLPNIGQSIRVHTSMMFSSWMGSDLTNDDLVHDTSFADDYVSSIKETPGSKGGKNYVLELIPNSGSPVVWGKVIYHISPEMVPVLQEFYNQAGTLVRTITFSDVKEMDGKVIPTRWVVRREGREGMTTMSLENIDFHAQMTDSVFSISTLGRQ